MTIDGYILQGVIGVVVDQSVCGVCGNVLGFAWYSCQNL
jgi:hypothetical protein